MSINVGFFVETPVAHNLTGGSRSFLDLVLRLKNKGVYPFVIVSEKWELTEILQKNNISFCVAKSFRPFVDIKNPPYFYRIRHLIKCLFNHFAYKKSIRYFKKHNVEIIHINSQFAGIFGANVANALTIPYVYHIREFLDKGFGLKFYNEAKALKAIDGAKKIIAISSSIEKYQKSIHSPSKVVKIYNGLDFSIIESHNDNSKIKFLSPHVDICIVGRVCSFKNQFDAVKAVELLIKTYNRDVSLYIIGFEGHDKYEEEIFTYINEHNLVNNIKLIPFNNDPFNIICNCDIGLICSEGEAFGRVTIEYFASKLLVFGANSGATPELINDGIDGYIFDLHDYKQLAYLINESLENKEKSVELIDAGYKKAIQNFSINKTSDAVLELYESILGGSEK